MIKNKTLFIILFLLVYKLLLNIVFDLKIIHWNDTQSYFDLSERLINFNLKGYEGQRSLGYPIVLAFFLNNKSTVLLFQILLSLLTAIINYQTIKSLINEKVSFVLTLFFHSFLHIQVFEYSILTENCTFFLISWMFYEMIHKNRIFIFIIIYCWMILIKPFYIYLPFLHVFYNIINCSFKFKLLYILFFPLFIFVGWSAINYYNTNYFVSSTYFGINKIQNCVNFCEKGPDEIMWVKKPYIQYKNKFQTNGLASPMCIWYMIDDGVFEEKKMTFPQLSNELGNYAEITIKNNPIDYIKQVLFLSYKEFWNVDVNLIHNTIFFSNYTTFVNLIWKSEAIVLRIVKTLFLLLFPFVIIKILKQRKIENIDFIYLCIQATAILQALTTYGSNERYSFPFEWSMIICFCFYIFNFRNMNILNKKFFQNKIIN